MGASKGQVAWNDSKTYKPCEYCGVAMKVKPSWLVENARGVKRFCNNTCRYAKGMSEAQKEKLSLAHKGKRNSPPSEFKPGQRASVSTEWASGTKFTGTPTEYRKLHLWVEASLGKPQECSQCLVRVMGKGIHWANISGSYKKDASDWIRLCAKCHFDFDVENGGHARKFQVGCV